MKLPNKFQFRLKHYPGFTHTGEVNEIGDYEVKWARGYPEHIKVIPIRVFDSCDVEWMTNDGYWQIVDESPQEQSLPELPDEFYFKVLGEGATYKMTLVDGYYRCVHSASNASPKHGAPHDVRNTALNVKGGVWVIVNVLTPEQQRANKEAREQIAQLEASIRINEQSVEHYNRLCNNYRERIEVLNSKIVEEN